MYQFLSISIHFSYKIGMIRYDLYLYIKCVQYIIDIIWPSYGLPSCSKSVNAPGDSNAGGATLLRGARDATTGTWWQSGSTGEGLSASRISADPTNSMPKLETKGGDS